MEFCGLTYMYITLDFAMGIENRIIITTKVVATRKIKDCDEIILHYVSTYR